jgi:nucleotide-binding universal stress UspA family protein
VPIDGSFQSKTSQQMAILISKLFKSQVTLIHVVLSELPSIAGERYSPREDTVPINAATYQFPRAIGLPKTKDNALPDDVIREVIARYRENGRWILNESSALFAANGIDASQKLLEETNVAETIIQEAEAGGFGLIVMGNSGDDENEPDSHLGSNAKKVAFRIKIPVLIVREKKDLRKILVPVDGSSKEKETIAKISMLAKAADSKVILFHVQEASLIRHRPEVKEIGVKILKNAAESFGEIPVEQILVSGDPAKAIIRAAEQNNVDLIALTGGGLGSLRGLLLGSVTDHVLNHATVSALVVK